MTSPARRLSLCALALTGGLLLAGCGEDPDRAASTGSPSSHAGGHSNGADSAAKGKAADVAFLTGMRPHHEQAVQMSDIVLAADGVPAGVAAIARQIKAAQDPEIAQMDEMLEDLGHDADGGHGSGHGGGHSDAHGGMLSEQAMAALREASGAEAARLYLEGMIAHHQGAIDASEAQIADGEHGPAVELAEQIAQAQAAEIVRMRELLTAL